MGCVDLIIRGLLFLSWFSLFCNIEFAASANVVGFLCLLIAQLFTNNFDETFYAKY